MDTVRIDEAALEQLKSALQIAGESYKINLSRLRYVIEEIASKDIEGEPATELLNKYRNREDMFRNIERAINDAEEYAGVKKSNFDALMSDVSSGLK